MGADNINSVVRRFSSMVDTSGAEPPRGIQVVPMLGGGVYTQTDQTDPTDNTFGRISLGILGAFVLGAVAFYVWTDGIQGGG
jgi:hypothetical protein